MHSIISWYCRRKLKRRRAAAVQNMYGAYVEVAAYSQTWDRRSSDTFLHNEALSWLSPEATNISATSSISVGSTMQDFATDLEDFILVCEVSEIEGPKPLFTVPQHIDASIDLNSLAEKIMSVDYHSGNSGPFAYSSDTQVILSNVADGLHALSDYFILYDISARGFVRPFCITYFSADKRKLTEYFECIRCRFLTISKYLKFGNRRLFLQELEQYLEDLQIAKDDYVKKYQDSKSNLGKESTSEASIINHFASSIIEAQHLLSVKRPLLEDATAAAMLWKVETKIKSLHNINFYQLIKPFVLAPPMHSPKLQSLLSDVKHNEMRSIFELCSWGVVIGLDMMISMQKYYKRDSMVLYLENEDLKLLEPDEGKILIGNHVLANAVLDPTTALLPNNSCDEDSLNIDKNLAKLEMQFIAVATSSKRPFSNLQSEPSEFESDSESDVYDDASEETGFPVPEPKAKNISSFFAGISWPSLLVNWHHFGDQSGLSQSPGKESYWSVLESLRNSKESSPELDSDVQLLEDRSSTPSDMHDTSKRGMTDIHGHSLASHLEFLTPDKPGFGIASVFDQFPSFPHILHSLLTGKTVVIVGNGSDEELVRSVVQALDIFVPEKETGRSTSVLPWCTVGFKTKDLNTLRLIGLCVPDHQSEFNYIPKVKQSQISVLNVAKNTYFGPLYMGNTLSSLFRIKRNSWDDAALLSYIHSLILDLVTNIAAHPTTLSKAESLQDELPKKSVDMLPDVGRANDDDEALIKQFSKLLHENV